MASVTVRKFEIKFSDKELADLKNRVKQTRWPEGETVPDDTQGVQLATMKKPADHWVKRYDWRKIEARLNSYPNFITTKAATSRLGNSQWHLQLNSANRLAH